MAMKPDLPWAKTLYAFMCKYRPEIGTPEFSEFMEDLRAVVVTSQQQILYDVATGKMKSPTLQNCSIRAITPKK